MKNVLLKAGILIFIIFLSNNLAGAANEYFRSVATGNWNAIGTWQMSTNSGGSWFAATSTPTDTSGEITIQSPNTVTVTVNVSADQLTVNTGGTLSINIGITFTLKDGAGEDLFLSTSGTISGPGTFQTQGADINSTIKSGAVFSAPLKINTGKFSSYDNSPPYTAKFSGDITVDAGAVFNVRTGGYTIQCMGNLTNNGDITSGNSNGSFIMSGSSLINNDSIRAGNLTFDDTTSLTGTGAYTSSDISITGTGRVTLSNNLTFSPPATFIISSGGVLNPNAKTFTINRGTVTINNAATILNSGIFQTQGTVSMIVKNGSNFNAPFKVNSGTATSSDNSPPYTANYKSSVTVDAGSVLTTPGGGYSNRVYGDVTNNGTISGSEFLMRGASLINNGTINPINLQFDSTTNISSTGTFSSSTILISGTGNITLLTNVTFSPGLNFTINNGGIFYPGSKTFTFNSGSFILNTGATVSGTGVNAGTLQTQGTVTFLFRNGSVFNSGVKVNTGTLTAYNDVSPYVAVYYGTITVDAGATLTQANGGYTTRAMNTVTNNGTITSPNGGNVFSMKGASFVNNSIVTCKTLNFDSTTIINGTGTYTGQNIDIGSTGNVSFANNVTFSISSAFTVNTGGILNPNTRTLTFTSGLLQVNNGGTVSSSGLIQTQGTVTIKNRVGSSFNAPVKTNTGTTLAYSDISPYYAVFNGAFTIDAGATLSGANGGYFIQVNGNVTNNGTINGNSTFRMRGPAMVNNNSISTTYLTFDSTTNLSGTGSFTSSYINFDSPANVTLGSNISFTPGNSLSMNSGSTLNPNTFIFKTTNTNYFYSSSTVTNSGTFRTQGSADLVIKSGSSFNAPLNVNTGTTSVYDNNSPYIGTVNGTITVDAAAVLTCANGGYTLRANNNVTNNGTISAASPAFKMFGTNFTNNGVVSFNNFTFESGTHTLSGTGSWTTNATVLNGGVVNLGSNHQMQSLTINAGGTFNVSTFKLMLKATNPIGNSGTFNTTTGTVEYNGTSAQSISTSGITYNKLIVNNSAGTSLASAVTVNDTLSVILGGLNLNGQILTLAPTNGYLSETAGNTVFGTSGYITTTRTLNAPSALNVAGLGAILTTTVNLGSTEIRRGHTVQNGLNAGTSILRYFDITPTTNTGLNATLIFKYDDTELNGKSEPSLVLYRSTNTGSTWTLRGGTVNVSTNQITLSAIDAFSRWSAGSGSTLPLAAQIKFIMEGFYNTGTGKLNMRDTARAYLRNSTSPYAIVDSAKSILDSVTFTGSFLFNNAPSGSYYIQTKHRNSLETWSKTAQSYTFGSTLSYDFTDNITKAFGNNMILKGTKYCIFSGDVLQDGIIDGSDGIIVDNDAANFESGYIKSDVNGDKFVDGSDASIVDNNAANFVSVARP